jgi:serine/threonine protein kinase
MSTAGERWVGQTLDERYRIVAVLGEGGMGAVFRAEQVRLGKPVAVKIILPEHTGNAELASRFAREAMVTAKLEHPHVVSAIDTGELPGGGAYLVMSLAPGRSLRHVMAERRGWRFACEVGAQIADALSAAHAIGVVHRDLKPENVMVEERGAGLHVRVLDFGIARALDVDPSKGPSTAPLTRVGTILGTPGYMPPEQALGDVVDVRADIYSLGVLIWEMSTGRRLFAQEELRDIAVAQLTEPIPELDAPDAPPELQSLLDASLMPKAADRPARVSDVLATLRRLALAGASSPPPEPSAPPAVSSAPIPATLGAGTPSSSRYGEATPSVARALGAPNVSPMLLVGGAIASVMTLLVLVGVVGVRACSNAAPAGELADVPEDLRPDAETLVASPDLLARAMAASRLEPARDRLPPFVGHLADFETAGDCEARRDAVRALERDGDRRAVGPLERIRALPAIGCGAGGSEDCHRCMRRDVDDALASLGEPVSQPDASTATPGASTGTAAPAGHPTKQPHGHGHPHGHRP